MRVLGCTLLTFAIVIVVGCGKTNNASKTDGEKEKTNAVLIIGVWEITKAPKEMGEKMPPEAAMEFTKDNKVKMTAKIEGKTTTLMEADYKVEGDKLNITSNDPKTKKEKTETSTIKTLNDKTLVVHDDKDKDKVMEFKKK
jgi:uncharacterized protein (TIGR03066 family)